MKKSKINLIILIIIGILIMAIGFDYVKGAESTPTQGVVTKNPCDGTTTTIKTSQDRFNDFVNELTNIKDFEVMTVGKDINGRNIIILWSKSLPKGTVIKNIGNSQIQSKTKASNRNKYYYTTHKRKYKKVNRNNRQVKRRPNELKKSDKIKIKKTDVKKDSTATSNELSVLNK